MPTTCPTCGHVVHPGRAACLYCGTRAPERAAPAQDSATCPRCRTAMTTVAVEGIHLDVCTGCGGTWYDRGEFEAHLSHVSRQRTGTATGLPPTLRETTVEYLPCARCGLAMLRKNFDGGSGVLVDVCLDHGLFLDPGELRQIVEYVGSERQETVRRMRDSQRQAGLENKVRSAQHAAARVRFHGSLTSSELWYDWLALWLD